MAQIALALNTTSGILELAIAQVNPLNYIKYSEWNLERELSFQIHTCLAEFIQGYEWSDLAFVAIASGVGSFTSTRIGVVLARTLSEQLGIPVYAVSCADIESFPQALVPNSSGQNHQINDLIKIAYDQWSIGEIPHWSMALPLYA
jgi:tRNA threonylcarbamoyladenosine biosynthesis protein TsaB